MKFVTEVMNSTPKFVADEEDIADWLSDQNGYPIESFKC